MISIIIPVYNIPEEYLNRCFNSICAQTLQEFEVIIVDDGSETICASFLQKMQERDSRFRVLHQKNQGVSAARNLGLEECRGEYITFVDGDDWVEECFLESALFALKESDADVVIGGLRIFDNGKSSEHKIPENHNLIYQGEDKRIVQQYILTAQYDREHPELRGLRCSGPWNKLIRRDCIGECKFKTNLPVYEDMVFNLDVIENARIITIVPEIWYTYAIYPTSAMRRYRPNGIQEQKEVIHYLFDLKRRYPLFKDAIAKKAAECLKKISSCTISHPDSQIQDRQKCWQEILNDFETKELLKDYTWWRYPGLRINEVIFTEMCRFRMSRLLVLTGEVKKCKFWRHR